MYTMSNSTEASYSKTPEARLAPPEAVINQTVSENIIQGINYNRTLQTEADILKYGALPGGNTDQGSIELAKLVKENEVKIYNTTLTGDVKASLLLETGIRFQPTVTDLEFYANFDKYDYPLAQQGNYFVAFNPNSSNIDIAAFSRDVYRITNTDNEADLYNKLMISEWQDIIKDSFNIGRRTDDQIDIIYDQNLGTFDLKAIAFVAKLKYHDPAKLTDPNFQDNRVFIGFRNEYYNEPVARLSRLANDAYVFLARFSPGPVDPIIAETIEVLTPNTSNIAQENEKLQADLIRKTAEEVIKLSNAEKASDIPLSNARLALIIGTVLAVIGVVILVGPPRKIKKSKND